jgi:hypothetical protein
MSVIVDARGNPYSGAIDLITDNAFIDTRPVFTILGSLNAETIMDLNGQSTAFFDVRTAALNATVVFEGTVDGSNWVGLSAWNLVTEAQLAALVITTTHGAVYAVGCAGLRRIRVRISAYTSGNVTISARATMSDFRIIAQPYPTLLHVTGVAAVNTGVTLTLPAAGAGLFHYITRISLRKQYAVVGVAAGAGVVITTTNLVGSPAWNTEQLAAPAGTNAHVIDERYTGNPLKCSVANTPTTFVAGAQLETIWRWNVSYFVGA